MHFNHVKQINNNHTHLSIILEQQDDIIFFGRIIFKQYSSISIRCTYYLSNEMNITQVSANFQLFHFTILLWCHYSLESA